MKKVFNKIISPRFYQYFLTINQKSNIRGNGVIKVGGVEQALRREDFSRTRIVGIFWLPISIGPSHPRIYNFLASNGSNESRGRLMKRIGTYTTRRESGTKGAPWLLESFTADCCVAPRRGADIRNWKFTLIIGRRANSWPFPFDRNKKVNFSLLNRVYIYIYTSCLLPCVPFLTRLAKILVQVRGRTLKAEPHAERIDWFVGMKRRNESIGLLNRNFVREFLNFSETVRLFEIICCPTDRETHDGYNGRWIDVG